jgi:hypothetical protein
VFWKLIDKHLPLVKVSLKDPIFAEGVLGDKMMGGSIPIRTRVGKISINYWLENPSRPNRNISSLLS